MLDETVVALCTTERWFAKATEGEAQTVARMDDLFAETPGNRREKKDWIEKLFNSAVYIKICVFVLTLTDHRRTLATLWKLLDRSSGQVMHTVVVRELNKPELRMRGFCQPHNVC